MKILWLIPALAMTAAGQAPAINPGGIQNAASYAGGPVAPGEIVVIYGSVLGPNQITQFKPSSAGLVATQLAGTTVFFNGIPGPVIYTSAAQVSAIVPYEITGETAYVEVQYQGLTSAPMAVPLATSTPGIFTSNATGGGLAAAVNLDGSINGTNHPISTGGYISLFATGEGQTSPAGQDGKLAAVPLPHPIGQVTATIGGYPANVQYAGGAPGEVAGVMQVNLQIPAGVPLGNPTPVAISVGGAISATATVAVQGATVVEGFAITSLSNSTPLPLTRLQIGTTGLNATAPVQIQFSNGSGFSVTETPIRVAPDGTVVAAVPLYTDPSSHSIGPGTVSVSLIQGSQTTQLMTLSIQNLPSVSSYGVQPGDISRAVFVFDSLLLGRRINQLQAFQASPANTVNTASAQATLATLLNASLGAPGDIDQVLKNNSVTISGGTLPNGMTLQFNSNTLDLMDRINGVFLTQTFGSLGAVPGTSLAAHPTQYGARLVPNAAPSQISNLLTLMKSVKGVDDLVQAAEQAANAKDWVDYVEAASKALGASLDLLPEELQKDWDLGAAAAILSNARTVGDTFGDLAAYGYGVLTGNQELQFNATQAMAALRSNLNDALNNLVDELTDGSPITLEDVSTIADLIKTYYEAGQTAIDNADSTSVEIANEIAGSPNGLPGVAFIDGQFGTPTNSQSTSGMYSVQISSNGISFSTLSDANGDYQLLTNISIPSSGSATATIQLLDPVTHAVLGSKTINLSSSAASCSDLQQALAAAISNLHECDCIQTDPETPCPTAAINACYSSAFTLISTLGQQLVQACTIAVQ